MKIAYLGSGEFGLECLNTMGSSSHDLEFIVTQPPALAGRGRKPRPTSVANWAIEHSVHYIEAEDINGSATVSEIAARRPDLIVVVAFGQKIGEQVIKLPPKGIINIHASLLPKYRGAAPINWAIINGEGETGISIITVVEKMDAGDILAQARTSIGADETAGELHDRLARLAAPLLMDTLDKIEKGTAVYTKQDHSEATLAPKLRKSDGFLDFSEPAQSLQRKIRGFWPWPGASAAYKSRKTHKSERATIAVAEVIKTSNPDNLPTGTLDQSLNIICGQNALKIERIKPDGSRLMEFRDFVNGRATRPGDTFIKIDQ